VVGVGEGVSEELAGRELTVDGSAGLVYAGILPTEEVDPAEVPGLVELINWARELSPVDVVDEAPGAVDLDAAGSALEEGAPDSDAIAAALRGADAARGSVLASAEGARAVVEAGIGEVENLPGQPVAALLLRFAQAKCNLEEER
jgi:pyruvate,orthophosphate dikinase